MWSKFLSCMYTFAASFEFWSFRCWHIRQICAAKCHNLCSVWTTVKVVSIRPKHHNMNVSERYRSTLFTFRHCSVEQLVPRDRRRRLSASQLNIHSIRGNVLFSDRNQYTVALMRHACVRRRLSVCLSVTLCIVAKRCVLEQKLLLTAYRKSYMRNRLVPKWMTLSFV